jgi:rhodanese-related sulfurtransferase
MLMDRGFVRVRPLTGGLDAWSAAGYNIERF